MQKRTIILILLLVCINSFSQIEKGKYFICFDYCYYDYCHGRYVIEFMENDTCKVIWSDDVSYRTFSGFYHLNDTSITFEPFEKSDLLNKIELKFRNGSYWYEYKCDDNQVKIRPLRKMKK